MTINDLKTLLDAATPGPCNCGKPRRGRAYGKQQCGLSCATKRHHERIALRRAYLIIAPAFLRLWEAAEKMSDYIEDDGTGPYFPNPSTAHALLFSMHATLQELRDTKGTQ